MRLIVVGTGYVGLVSGACFSEMGNKVTCVDVDQDKVDKLKKGVIPIYEPGLGRIVEKNIAIGNLFFSTDLVEVIGDADILFIAVGTPMGEDGSADLQHVLDVAVQVGKTMTSPLIIVNKSTVPVGTADLVKSIITKELKERGVEISFDVVSNPEFLKEGSAIRDFMSPDRVVIGTSNEAVLKKMKQLYLPFTVLRERFVTMDIRSAEMTKYAANAMLATKISFINEISNICERVGADANSVRIGIGSDSRIGYSFIYPGCGYGGSCFPKDIKALKRTAEDYGYFPKLISAVEAVNDEQKSVLARKVVARFGEDLSGRVFAIWGLSFKPGTDDMRAAPSIVVINDLAERGAKFKVFDPKAMEQASKFYLKNLDCITYVKSKYQALEDSDALILLTEWKEFRSPDFTEVKTLLKSPVIFDGRNQYVGYDLFSQGFDYFCIGMSVSKD